MIRQKINLYEKIKQATKHEWRLCEDQRSAHWNHHYIDVGHKKVKMLEAQAELFAQFTRIEKVEI